MIGKKLAARFTLSLLPAERAVDLVRGLLAEHGEPLVEVRAQGEHMVACLVVQADKLVVKQCRALGLDVKPGATAVFGLEGSDAARLFPQLAEPQRAWLTAPCGPRETKALLLAGGFALLSIEAQGGRTTVSAPP